MMDELLGLESNNEDKMYRLCEAVQRDLFNEIFRNEFLERQGLVEGFEKVNKVKKMPWQDISQCLFENLQALSGDIPVKQLRPFQEKLMGVMLRRNRKLSEGTIDHAKQELQLAGLFDKDSDYNGMLAEAVMELMEVFSKQDHSGSSAAMVRDLFSKLSNFERLTELTDSKKEWMDVTEFGAKNKPMWQSRRCPSAFSEDGGKTYYDLNDACFKQTDEDGTWGIVPEDYGKERTIHTSKAA